jgi:hypothetical protein
MRSFAWRTRTRLSPAAKLRAMAAKVRIRPEVITEHRLRIEMYGLEDEDIENTIRMKGWAWVRSREAWVYAGEPDFVNRQIREVIIALPDMAFDESGIEESIRTVEAKARNEEERAEGRDLLRRAFEKTGQLPEAKEFLRD